MNFSPHLHRQLKFVLENLQQSWSDSQSLCRPPPCSTDHLRLTPWMRPTSDIEITQVDKLPHLTDRFYVKLELITTNAIQIIFQCSTLTYILTTCNDLRGTFSMQEMSSTIRSTVFWDPNSCVLL